MALDLKNKLRVEGTLVADLFIDQYMAAANGEYVKVYLYLLRHSEEDLSLSSIADALNHTESDVRRALSYWEKQGVLQPVSFPQNKEKTVQDKPVSRPADKPAAVVKEVQAPVRAPYSQAQISRLTGDEDFSQLLYIAQKYMNKVFTQRECEVFAYLYDGLHMSVELLEYLVEYCAQSGHTSIRYIETVALNWHEKGFKTAETAKAYSDTFVKDSYAVMRAFGLTERSPGESEKQMIETWFKTYGFAKDMVVEACNRTLEATHNPSFRYADKILSEWKKAGVKNLSDVRVLDQKRHTSTASKPTAKKTTNNQFHNFNQRDTDYDAMILQGLKEQ